MIDWLCDNEGIVDCFMVLQEGLKRHDKFFLEKEKLLLRWCLDY
jgi:hypothetical protein